MIKNEMQYRITRAQAERFERTLAELRSDNGGDRDFHPLIVKAREDAISSQIEDLRSELREYEDLRDGKFDMTELGMVSSLPETLIKARIAPGMSQRELAERIGLKQQQIQHYEATDYASASLSRIREVISGLDEGA